MHQDLPSTGRRRAVAEGIVLALAAALAACAWGLDPAWFDRHFLPNFFHPRPRQMALLAALRLALAAGAIVLAVYVRPRLGRLAARKSPGELAHAAAPTMLAVLAALVVSEGLLHLFPSHATRQAPTMREPLRRRDGQLGWVYIAPRVAHDTSGGRDVIYVFDAAGHRVSRPDRPVDPARPTILFTGESIMAGHGLAWRDTIPAQVEALTGLQGANLAVGGYATDQAYLRLKTELPLYRDPRAVVILFMPSIFFRNLDTDRPHLGPGLAWRPPAARLRLAQAARGLVAYHTAREIDGGVAVTREALAGAIALARARGAVPLILVPQLTPETPAEREIRRRVLDQPRLPYVLVPADPAFHQPGNPHPDARATRRLAQAVAKALKAKGLKAEGLKAEGLSTAVTPRPRP